MTTVEVGDLVTADLLDLMLNPPVTRLIQQSAQSVGSGSTAALTFGVGSEDIDTHGFHDTAVNTTRITPTVAGLYAAKASVSFASATTTTAVVAQIAKNGTALSNGVRIRHLSLALVSSSIAEAIVSCNGSSDYVEALAGQSDSGAAARNTSAVAGQLSTFELVFLRPL